MPAPNDRLIRHPAEPRGGPIPPGMRDNGPPHNGPLCLGPTGDWLCRRRGDDGQSDHAPYVEGEYLTALSPTEPTPEEPRMHIHPHRPADVAPHSFARQGWRWWLCRHCYAPKSLHPRRTWGRARPLGDHQYLSRRAPHFKEGW